MSLKKLHWFLSSQIGVDLRKGFHSATGFVRFVKDLYTFVISYRLGQGPVSILPCLHDFRDAPGAYAHEYFYQDFLCVRLIAERHPRQHLDIGSRIDGFIGALSTHVAVTVLDVRPGFIEGMPSIRFVQADIGSGQFASNDYHGIKSISCLHTLEHIGLGRYGDVVDPNAVAIAFNNVLSLVSDEDTRLYLSIPIGRARVIFNERYIFSWEQVRNLYSENSIDVGEYYTIGANGFIKGDKLDQLDGLEDQLVLFVLKMRGT